MILAILNLYVGPMPPIKFQLNPTYSFGEVSFEDFQDGNMVAILDIETE